MKKISLFIILILIITAIFYFWQENKNTAIQNINSSDNEISISFQFSEEEIIQTNFHFKTPLDLVHITKSISIQESWNCQGEDYGDMGILVTQIRDKKNGQDNKYWQYFVDGQQPQISADKYFPKNNTHIEWKFQKSEF